MMKTIPLVSLLVALVISTSVAQDGANSIVSNGDFEGGSTGWPTGKGITIEEEDGNKFLRLHSSEPGTQVQAFRRIDITGGPQKLRVSFRVSRTNVVPGAENWHTARVVMHFKDANGQALKPGPQPFAFKGESNGWVDKSVEVIVPEGTTTLEFMPALFQVAQGTLDIDDVVIVPVDL